MALYNHASTSKSVSQSGRSEFDILKTSHKFLREDEESGGNALSWDEQLAKKYYSSLYREYAVCDLKHYKSGNFALRWRTESEVIFGAGETTCGNTRCPLHTERGMHDGGRSLKTLELPFSYVEAGENKFALVKVVLCDKCCKKIMWKRFKEKEQEKFGVGGNAHVAKEEDDEDGPEAGAPAATTFGPRSVREESSSSRHGRDEHARRHETSAVVDRSSRRRNSRSRSPARAHPNAQRRRSLPLQRTI